LFRKFLQRESIFDQYDLVAIHQIINLISYFYEVQDPTSKYNGVSWNTRDKKWLTQVMHNGKKYSPGKFDNEKHAAMQVNLLCDKFGIKRKNPMIDLEPDAIQQVIHSLSIVQEDVKSKTSFD